MKIGKGLLIKKRRREECKNKKTVACLVGDSLVKHMYK